MTSPSRSALSGRLPALTAVARRLQLDHGITVVPTPDLPPGLLGELDLPQGILATDSRADDVDQVWLCADALALLSVGEAASAAQPVDEDADPVEVLAPLLLALLPGGRGR
jgi:hypothetical protein